MRKTSKIRAITLRSQGRAETRPLAIRAASLVILVAGAAGTANAQILVSEAYGDQMIGGTVTIEWAGLTSGIVAGTTIAPIVLGPGTREAIATVPGLFGGPGASFSVENETFLAGWELTNNSFNFIISAATVNLRGSVSLFDDNFGLALGGTPNGSNGREGVIYIAALSSAPAHTPPPPSLEFDPWAPVPNVNVGDMYWQERIEWNRFRVVGPVFDPGQNFVYRDDTDVIPTPGAIALLGFAAALTRRRRSRA